MMTDAADSPLACLPAGLTAEEAEFVHLTEVLGMPQRKAAQMAGLAYNVMAQHHIVQAREQVRAEVRGNLNVTKDDVTHMLLDARHRAQLLAEPATEVMAIDRIIKLHGLDAPQRVDVNLHTSVEVLQSHVKQLSDTDLVRALGAGNVIDAEFYATKTRQG